LIATDEIVIITPGTVLRHPRMIITFAGHSKFVKVTFPIPKPSPNQRTVNMMAGAISPSIPKMMTIRFVVNLSLRA